jgi:serine protease AprX
MRRWSISLILLVTLSFTLPAQQIGKGEYWIYFKDKNNNGYNIGQPESFLSERSLNRRAWQGLGVDETDEPVSMAYLDTLRGMGVEIRHVSRWLNGVAMVNATTQLFDQVLEKTFVDTLPWAPATDEIYFPPKTSVKRFEPPLEQSPDFDYGIAKAQVLQTRTDVLHGDGYTGRGVWVGVLDAGFRNVDSLPSFKPMIDEDRIIGTRNFVSDSSVYRIVNSHGMSVLSIIGGLWEGNMMGTAPHASFFLCATENIWSETHMEEIAWIEAAEYLDSLGFDVFNTSLGYTNFDSTLWDYTYEDLDGKTTFISRAASMTAAKGIISCNSAGNEGAKSWYHIMAPADAFDILSVGAVDSSGVIANFSSRGPTFDGRISPLVAAIGRGTGRQYIDGRALPGNGTSFSSPVIAGAVASLWQAYPDVSAKEMIYRIRESGNNFRNPDVTYGFGIPDFAHTYWSISGSREILKNDMALVYPNPASDFFRISLPESAAGVYTLNLHDLHGRVVFTGPFSLPGEVALPPEIESGIYFLEARSERHLFRNRIIIQ